MWTFEAHLLAGVVDALNVANWQRVGRNSGRPKPIKRPGVADANTRTLGKDPLPTDEMAEWLGGAFAAAEAA